MNKTIREKVQQNLREYALWYDTVFTPRKTECDHLINGTQFESIHGTAWQRIGAFEKCKDICTRCGRTVRVLIRIAKEA